MSGAVVSSAPQILRNMTDAIMHRGPDSDGHWQDPDAGIALGHRRLAVVDLSAAGEQPMRSVSGRYVIAFNGEIYNHLQIRAELEKYRDPPVWRGNADTETLLAAFEIWGIETAVSKCVGMFAIALWDRQTQRLTLARDRLGEKPLFYGWHGRGDAAVFLFGSELKAMRAHPTFCAQVNRDALALYLRQMAVPGTHSIYQGIQKLSPGTFLTVSRARPQPVIKPYWSASEIAERGIAAPYKGKADGAINRLEALLKDAVRGQMMADVPLGAFLSGGVDSSTVVALMQAQSTRAVKTFSIGFHEEEFNEAEHAKAVARHLGTEHTELYVTSKQAMDVIPKLPALYDEPFADSSQIPTYLVSELARQHVTVSLSGDGGDELFCGYRRYTDTARLWSRLSILPVPLRKTIAQIVRTVSPSALNWVGKQIGSDSRWARLGDRLHKGAEVITCSSLEALYMGMVSNWHESEMEVIRDHKHSTPLTSLHTELSGMSGIERMMALDLVTYLADDILTKVDRAGMGVSLETRVPLLDHRVVEFAWSLPLHYKLRPEGNAVTSKWALRQVLYRHVPQVLIERPKMGFGVPIDAWLRGPLRDWAEDLLDESRLRREGFFNPEPIRKKWREHLSGHRNWRNQLWAILMFQAWLENTRRV